MKKSILSFCMFLSALLIIPSFTACGSLGAGSAGGSLQTIAKVANIASTAKQITSVLGPILGLKQDQKTSFTDIFSNYIGGTNKLAPLASSDKNAYKSQLGELNKGTLGKIGNVLTIAQYAKLLGLGNNDGKKNDKGGLLAQIKQQNDGNVSKDVVNVLSGLLLN